MPRSSVSLPLPTKLGVNPPVAMFPTRVSTDYRLSCWGWFRCSATTHYIRQTLCDRSPSTARATFILQNAACKRFRHRQYRRSSRCSTGLLARRMRIRSELSSRANGVRFDRDPNLNYRVWGTSTGRGVRGTISKRWIILSDLDGIKP